MQSYAHFYEDPLVGSRHGYARLMDINKELPAAPTNLQNSAGVLHVRQGHQLSLQPFTVWSLPEMHGYVAIVQLFHHASHFTVHVPQSTESRHPAESWVVYTFSKPVKGQLHMLIYTLRVISTLNVHGLEDLAALHVMSSYGIIHACILCCCILQSHVYIYITILSLH